MSEDISIQELLKTPREDIIDTLKGLVALFTFFGIFVVLICAIIGWFW